MRRSLIAGITGSVLLLGASVAAIAFFTADGSPPVTPAPDATQRVAALAAGAVDSAAAPVQETSAPPPPSTPLAVASFATGEPPRRKGAVHRTAPPPSPQVRAVRRGFRAELGAGLAELRNTVSACSVSGASFTLDLETVAGAVRVVAATLESRGPATTDADVACARGLLGGRVIDAPSAEPGRRWQMPFSVN